MKNLYVLIDDDEIVRLSWQMVAKSKNIELHHFPSLKSLLDKIHLFPSETLFYIDYFLGQENGDEVAARLSSLGYKNLYLVTGDSQIEMSPLFLKRLSKDPPWI